MNRAWGAAMAALAGLAACNEDKLVTTIDQARQVEIQTQTPAFSPSPRSTDDITAILDQYPAEDSTRRAKRLSKAAAKPPSGASLTALALFYRDRAFAANEVGDAVQALEDYRLARRYSDDGGLRGAWVGIYRGLAEAEANVGNFLGAIDVMHDAVRKATNSVGNMEILAQLYSEIGHPLLADPWIRGVRAHSFSVSRTNPPDPWRMPSVEYVLLQNQGRWAEAELFVRLSIEAHRTAPADRKAEAGERWAPNRRRVLAVNLMRQGRLAEAEAEAREALVALLKVTGKHSVDVADTTNTLAAIVLASGRFEEAEKLSRAALDVLRGVGVLEASRTFAGARHALGEALVAQRRWSDAAAEFRAAKAAFGTDTKPYTELFGRDASAALALLRAGSAAEARAFAEMAHRARSVALGNAAYETAEAAALVALADAAEGRAAEALSRMRQAVPVLVAGTQKRAGDGAAINDVLAIAIFESYMTLLLQDLPRVAFSAEQRSRVEEAFRIADIARGKSVHRAVKEAAVRTAARESGLSDLVRREQDARERWQALSVSLSKVLASSGDTQKLVDTLRQQIGELREAETTIRAETLRRFPAYSQLVQPAPVGVEQARQSLRPGEALLATYVGERQTFIWLVSPSAPVAFATADLGHAQVKRMVRELRRSLDPKATSLGDIPAYDVTLAHELYLRLLKPLEGAWNGATKLLVVAQGPLGQLPFEVLVTQPHQLATARSGEVLFANYRAVPWLARQAAVTWLPSVASLTTLRAAAPPAANRRAFAGFGDPWFNPRQAEAARQVATAAPADDAMSARGLLLNRRSVPEAERDPSFRLAHLPRLPEPRTRCA